MPLGHISAELDFFDDAVSEQRLEFRIRYLRPAALPAVSHQRKRDKQDEN
jgi:hypothetical protein